MPNPQESIDAILAKNLVVARVVRGITQQELAQRADISRATIAQIETGYSDPRLFTITDLAGALDIPLILLLIGSRDLRAIASTSNTSFDADTNAAAEKLPSTDIDRMTRLLHSGMLKDRVRAARIGADVARQLGGGPSAEICSAILSAILPGEGMLVGTRVGRVLDERVSVPAL